MFSLHSSTALITGASGAIGQAIALTLAAQGATIALSGTKKLALEQLAHKIHRETGQNPNIFPCQLTEAESLEALIPKVEAAFGKVDILINNAGLTRDALTVRMKDEDWDLVLAVNLTACFKLCRAAVRGMMKRRYGRIINISSVVGTTGNPGQANYCASKAAMVGMSKALAQEVASRGITVNCIAPGFIESDMTGSLPPAIQEKILSTIPAARMGSPAEIASAVAYLSSKETAYITGHILHVNGGMLMA